MTANACGLKPIDQLMETNLQKSRMQIPRCFLIDNYHARIISFDGESVDEEILTAVLYAHTHTKYTMYKCLERKTSQQKRSHVSILDWIMLWTARYWTTMKSKLLSPTLH